jgi:futalosine hydrolase
VELEARALATELVGAEPLVIGPRSALSGTLDGVPVVLLATGMGKTNAAQALTSLLERQELRGVLSFGVGGAYPGSELAVADVALARSEIYGDEGVAAPSGWMGTEGIGIPLVERGDERWFDEFPLDAELVERAALALGAGGVPCASGPFVTVSACSGTTVRGRELAERHGAICESMEGASLAHICTLYEVPFLEVRGISNAVEDRDLTRWRLRDAADAACRAARLLVRAGVL